MLSPYLTSSSNSLTQLAAPSYSNFCLYLAFWTLSWIPSYLYGFFWWVPIARLSDSSSDPLNIGAHQGSALLFKASKNSLTAAKTYLGQWNKDHFFPGCKSHGVSWLGDTCLWGKKETGREWPRCVPGGIACLEPTNAQFFTLFSSLPTINYPVAFCPGS